MRTKQALELIEMELHSALQKHEPMATVHDGWAVIYEELDELWDEVKKRPSHRNVNRLRDEATQVAAMALRFIMDLT